MPEFVPLLYRTYGSEVLSEPLSFGIDLYFNEVKFRNDEFVEDVWKKIAFSPFSSKKSPSLSEFKKGLKSEVKSKQQAEKMASSYGVGTIKGSI